jgi:CelD/BcsL family acetyltransferase involved in cellulose biosynthesis
VNRAKDTHYQFTVTRQIESSLQCQEELSVPESRSPVLLEAADERWITFLTQSGKANIFHHPAWSQLLADSYNYKTFVVVDLDQDGEICAGLPMAQVKSLLTGQRLVSLPFSDHCAPIYQDDNALAELTDDLVVLCQEDGIPMMELRAKFLTHPSIQRYSHHVLHTICLEHDVDSVFSRLHSMHKRNIKKAKKGGIRVIEGTTDNELEVFYNLHLQTRRRQGVPIQPRKFFELLVRNILDQGLGFVLLAYTGDECVAGGVFLHWQHTLTYKYGASNELGRNLRANNLLMWFAIRWGCENGYQVFDMGKTDQANTGLRQFKSRWGAVEESLVYSILSERPHLQTEGKLQGVMQTVIRNSPSWVCRVTGELLYRHYA